MRKTPTFLLLLVVLTGAQLVFSQRKSTRPAVRTVTARGIVTDERLAVVRETPSFDARIVTRLRRGRAVVIGATTLNVDGGFYRVTVSRKRQGWLLREAVTSANRPRDDERLARLIEASEGFERAHRARIFLDLYPTSPLRPAILMIFGDAIDAAAAKLTRDARKRLSERSLSGSEASRRGFYLSFARLDRYRRLGASFRFDEVSGRIRYDGASWREITERYAESEIAAEARKKLAAAVKDERAS